jgi:hypothetical protein
MHPVEITLIAVARRDGFETFTHPAADTDWVALEVIKVALL